MVNERYRKMETDQRGFTLVELLAVLTLATICFALIFGIWLSGQKSATRTMTENDLQADANLVQKRLTEAFYDKNQKPFTLSLNYGQVELKYDGSDKAEALSAANLIYSGSSSSQTVNPSTQKLDMDYTIKPRNTSSGDLSFHLNTTIYFPWKEEESGVSQ
jgi:prepilin-type N-terminal cleavage/methylation domain